MMGEPANTLNYMIAGFAVIFSAMTGYAISLFVRFRRLQRELEMMEEINEVKSRE